MLFAARPDITQLPVEAVVGQAEQRLGLAIGIMGEKRAVLAAQVHVAEKGDTSRVTLQIFLGGHGPGGFTWWNLKLIVANDFVANPLGDRLFGKAQPDGDLLGLVLAGGAVMDLEHQYHSFGN